MWGMFPCCSMRNKQRKVWGQFQVLNLYLVAVHGNMRLKEVKEPKESIFGPKDLTDHGT